MVELAEQEASVVEPFEFRSSSVGREQKVLFYLWKSVAYFLADSLPYLSLAAFFLPAFFSVFSLPYKIKYDRNYTKEKSNDCIRQRVRVSYLVDWLGFNKRHDFHAAHVRLQHLGNQHSFVFCV